MHNFYFINISLSRHFHIINFNYSSYNNKRWAAHSGSDSDDFLIFIGYMSDNKGLVFGINYERHGITYNFPPEVKLESRFSIMKKYNRLKIYLNYENEFVDNLEFNWGERKGKVWWVGVERTINDNDYRSFRKRFSR